jgi:hypothetical protein
MATQPKTITPCRKTYAIATVSTSTDGLSDVVDLGGMSLSSIQNATDWTAASFTFKASASTTATMNSVYHTTAAVELTYGTTPSMFHVLDPAFFAGMRYIQIRSGTSAVPVAQAAARSVILGLSPLGQEK